MLRSSFEAIYPDAYLTRLSRSESPLIEPKDLIWGSGCNLLTDDGTVAGMIYLTRQSFLFVPRKQVTDYQIEFSWSDIRHISKITRILEKGIEIGTASRVVSLVSMKDRDVGFD
jgi:hypothetical protein